MALLDFVFDARFFACMQPEDVPMFVITNGYNAPYHDLRVDLDGTPLNVPADPAPLAANANANAQHATEQVEESENAYKVWLEQCKQIDEDTRLADIAYKDARDFAKDEMVRLNNLTAQAREHWRACRQIQKPPQPTSSRRKK